MVVEREHVFLPRIGPPLNTQSSESWVLTPVKYVLKSELCCKFTAAEVFWGGNKKRDLFKSKQDIVYAYF